MKFLKATALLLVSVLLIPSVVIGAAVNFDHSSPNTVIRLDTSQDPKFDWKIIEPWFEYVDCPESLEDIATHPDYGSIKFSDWKDLMPVSRGIWALLHQDLPPEFDLESPYFSYKKLNEDFRSLHITFYMHGLSTITILSGRTVVEVVENQCGEDCGYDFSTVSVNLDEGKGAGVSEFNVSLSTSPGAFVLIDIIEASSLEVTSPPITTTRTTIEPTSAVSDSNSDSTETSTDSESDASESPTGSTTDLTTEFDESPTASNTGLTTESDSDTTPSSSSQSTATSTSKPAPSENPTTDESSRSDPTSESNATSAIPSESTFTTENPTLTTEGSSSAILADFVRIIIPLTLLNLFLFKM